MTDDEIYEMSLALVLQHNPSIAETPIDLEELASIGISEKQFKHKLLSDALDKLARKNGLTPYEFQFQLLEEAGFDLTAERERATKAEMAILGIS